VISYAAYGEAVLYATHDKTVANQTDIRLYDGSQTYDIRHDSQDGSPLLAISAYNGSQYVAASSSKADAVYIYKDPALQVQNKQIGVAVPVRVMRLQGPSFAAFSASGQ